MAQRVHVSIWYILRAQRGSHIPTLRPKYIPYTWTLRVGVSPKHWSYVRLYRGYALVILGLYWGFIIGDYVKENVNYNNGLYRV